MNKEEGTMKKYFKITLFFLISISIFFLIKCAVNPVTGKKEIMLVSQKMEIGLGQEIDRGLRQEYGIYQDPQLNAYIDHVGQKMIPFTHRPNLKYHFAILDTPVENAFAAPGGYIYITRGLLSLMNSEAELATVLGHELGHVNARHSARSMTRNILFTLGIALVGELDEDLKKITPIAMAATQLLFLKYSRSDEYQADSLGIQYSHKVGYSADRMIQFFSSLQRLTEDRGGTHLPNFLSTHPLTPRRIQRVKELLQTDEYVQKEGSPTLAVKRDSYLRKIDGLIYGKNPKQGYVEANTFYHPDMKFYFRIPHGWKISNTPQQVTMMQPKGKAIILLKAETTNENLNTYAKKMHKNLSNPQIIQEGFRYVNGLNAFHSLIKSYTLNSEKQASNEMKVLVSCIRKGDVVFTYFSAATLADFSTYQNSIVNTINSFKTLSSSRHLRRSPYRVSIKRVQGNPSLSHFLTTLGVPKKNWKNITLINAMELDQKLKPNQLIKVIH
jgi:predicted Zn-dependent protease